ncbi:NUDIX hydrolase [Nocardioides daphniae]|uniref:NUDIX domain-containing protein n=1 Tax=Nocardioides daphniae TaxID=402297 RepID=A0A4P7UHU9_9ACTN|nr:NUDIX domain-containing protein [Nocardioides daphniae]QCC78189.1 NUDIX domain-containing protein [Nocardioides daphniae]GGD21129.1 hypothetical protein GCM10007231_20340 [Nocardioides daphniae]
MNAPGSLPRYQRVAAYAVIRRTLADGTDEILLSRVAERISAQEMWTLPGGGVDHGEDPRDAVVREVYEEAGLAAAVGETAHVYSAYMPGVRRDGRMVDAHALRIVYEGWVAKDAPAPQVMEVDGSTVESAWKPIADVVTGKVPVFAMVADALGDLQPTRLQRLAAYGVVTRQGADGEEWLMTRISSAGFHSGAWTLPGGGVEHGEPPADALAREVLEECGVGCEVGELLGVHDEHFTGTSPEGRLEDYHGVHLVFKAALAEGAEPYVAELGGTTDAVEFVPLSRLRSGEVELHDVARYAVEHWSAR